jgi:hypothetical protein
MTALFAAASRVILKKLHLMTALRAPGLKDGAWFPVSRVLSGAFHGFRPIVLTFVYIIDLKA